MANKTKTPSSVQEIQVWMPNGEQGDQNLPSLQEYIDSAIRQDGALYAALADCKSYNKVLAQLTRIAVGIALFMNSQGIPVRDSDTQHNIRDSFAKAIKFYMQDILDPPDGSEGLKQDISYEPQKVQLLQATPAGMPVSVKTYEVGKMNTLVYFEGVLMDKGSQGDTQGTPSWFEVGDTGTSSSVIKFNCDLPAGSTLTLIRFGNVRFNT